MIRICLFLNIVNSIDVYSKDLIKIIFSLYKLIPIVNCRSLLKEWSLGESVRYKPRTREGEGRFTRKIRKLIDG